MIANELATGSAVEIQLDGERLVTFPSDAPAQDGVYLTPGWIDVQVNGFAGHDVNVPGTPPEDFEKMTTSLHAVGVTRFLPTVVTNSFDHMIHCLRAISDACNASQAVRNAVAGIHLEGPFISPEDGARGAHPREYVVPPTLELFERLQHAARGSIRLVTLAPEQHGAIPLIRHLHQNGIVAALGHTLADYDNVTAAVKAGARLSTHLGNGVPAMLPRHPNVIWEQLAEPHLTASAIFDGHHLPPSLMRVLYRVKGPNGLILTSDAVALAGMAPGVYEGQVGGKVELSNNGKLTMYGTQYLAGSASSLINGIHTALQVVGVPLEEAITMVTRTPTALLDLPERNDHTLVRLGDHGPEALLTTVGGRVAHAIPAIQKELTC